MYQWEDSPVEIKPLPVKRDWMDFTDKKHAYNCFPLSMANRIGWGVSLKENLSFIWDGINDSSSVHVKILSDSQFFHPNRGNRTISIETGVRISPQKNVSLLTTPPPNIFYDGFQCISTLISTSVLVSPLPIGIMVYKPNEIITIKKGSIIASLLPVKLQELNEYEILVKRGHPEFEQNEEWCQRIYERSQVSREMNSKGKWTHFYRNAVDHKGIPLGSHEAKSITMKVNHED